MEWTKTFYYWFSSKTFWLRFVVSDQCDGYCHCLCLSRPKKWKWRTKIWQLVCMFGPVFWPKLRHFNRYYIMQINYTRQINLVSLKKYWYLRSWGSYLGLILMYWHTFLAIFKHFHLSIQYKESMILDLFVNFILLVYCGRKIGVASGGLGLKRPNQTKKLAHWLDPKGDPEISTSEILGDQKPLPSL